jgi:hypothetical protein
MKERFNKWLDKPVTWRSYLRLSGIVVIIYLIGYDVFMASLWHNEIYDIIDDLRPKKKNKDK